ncbi:MAG TPA: 3-hydroxyacyl-CoA dehydrogenase family protein [Thermoanaerobaculia bacterium]|nr:3-hydroxyacyl-CoA dehydrogenase family protein [Thermoanaerobaculia bacterium]
MSVKVVAILGAGTMGRGIAQTVATCGLTARLFDVSKDALREAIANALAGIARTEAKGKITRDEAENAREHLAGVAELEKAVLGADLVIEAVPESVELKTALYAKVEPLLQENAILASNTSSIPLRVLSEKLARPERFLGLHFFNPVPLMKLLEIVVGAKTDPSVVDAASAFAERIGKEAILVKDSPGFATSRLGVAIGIEAMRMLEDGVASVDDIDKAMELGYAHPMGPLRLTDLVGLDVRLAIAEALEKELGPRFAPPKILREKVEKGELGKKSGRGFYTWEPSGAFKKSS